MDVNFTTDLWSSELSWLSVMVISVGQNVHIWASLRNGVSLPHHMARLLVGAPFESSGQHQTGDVYKCAVDDGSNSSCTRLNLGARLPRFCADFISDGKFHLGCRDFHGESAASEFSVSC